jgi:hypothetical protein
MCASGACTLDSGSVSKTRTGGGDEAELLRITVIGQELLANRDSGEFRDQNESTFYLCQRFVSIRAHPKNLQETLVRDSSLTRWGRLEPREKHVLRSSVNLKSMERFGLNEAGRDARIQPSTGVFP